MAHKISTTGRGLLLAIYCQFQRLLFFQLVLKQSVQLISRYVHLAVSYLLIKIVEYCGDRQLLRPHLVFLLPGLSSIRYIEPVYD